MITGSRLDKATLTVRDRVEEAGAIPATDLSQLLTGLQTTVFLLGAQAEGIRVDERFRPGDSLRSHYQLIVRTPVPGSYVLHLELWDTRRQPDVLPDEKILQKIHDVLGSIGARSHETLRALLPDTGIRDRVLREFGKLLPPPGAGWTIDFIADARPKPVSLASSSVSIVEKWLTAEPTVGLMSVIGELIRIDFEQHKLEIRHPVSKRAIACFYRPEVEDALVQQRHEPIQVTGEFALDEDGFPQQLFNVTMIEPVDLSPFIVDSVTLSSGRCIGFIEAREITPSLDDETQQYFMASLPDLGLQVLGETRDELVTNVGSDLAFLWETYGLVDPQLLDDGATQLRAELLATMKERPADGLCQ